ncbi:hypothetical protein AWB77_06826 [Caballeronia fortuita]|uniref:Uncharacterized protein n=2 Tax=Caballeronia fortuita TaxID=1777138 RepID=A0A158E9P4_9BURK|nr:hypothetical protein AWB77_06826 [Caballeronia fortuita]
MRRQVAARGQMAEIGASALRRIMRFLDPDLFSVLDEVLSFGLGYATNPTGYQLFMEQLTAFRDDLVERGAARRTLGEIEFGPFLLARQKVRSKPAAR